MKLFGARSPPFMTSDVIFLQAKWTKIKERVEGWKSGKKSTFKHITVCPMCSHAVNDSKLLSTSFIMEKIVALFWVAKQVQEFPYIFLKQVTKCLGSHVCRLIFIDKQLQHL